MAASLTLVTVRQGANGIITINYGDGVGMEFRNKAHAMEWAASLDAPSPETAELLRRLILCWWLRRDPTAATPALVQGKTITLDLLSTPVLTVL